jgi:hypothetical protein
MTSNTNSTDITEPNQFIRWWIWIWYNDITRLFFVMFGGILLLIVPLLIFVGVTGEWLKQCTIFSYLGVVVWAMVDNDYSNLNRIGLDVHRHPLKK